MLASYKELQVWQKSMQLVKSIYRLARLFPPEEKFSLFSQMTRAAVSIPSNIAEGYGRGSRKDYIHFLHVSRGSLYELETQLIIAQDIGYVPNDCDLFLKVDEISRMLGRMIITLQTQTTNQ